MKRLRCVSVYEAGGAMSSLPDELKLEIFQRLLPSPLVLARASAVCREWRRVVNDPDFLRRLYRARHGAPLTMGFFHNSSDRPCVLVHAGDPASFRFDDAVTYDGLDCRWKFVDCRHGRVLLRSCYWYMLLVWHPMTGERHLVRTGGLLSGGRDDHDYSAALLCDCATDDAGETCHTGPYRVAVVYPYSPGRLAVRVFSSLTSNWSPPRPRSTEPLPPGRKIRPNPCVVVGNTLYQTLADYYVLAFDTVQGSLDTFERPKWGNVRLLKAEGGVLGLAGVQNSTLRLWTREGGTWVLRSTVDLTKIIAGLAMAPSPRTDSRFPFMPPVKIIGVDEEGDALFLWTMVGIFMLRPKSMELTKVHETADNMEKVYPYAAFYLSPTRRTMTEQ